MEDGAGLKALYGYSEIKEVTALKGLMLRLELMNGSRALVSFNHKVNQARFFVLTKEGIWFTAKPRKALNVYWTKTAGTQAIDSLGVTLCEALEIALEKEDEHAPLIKSVTPMRDFILRIALQNGSGLYVNMKPWLAGARYNRLREKKIWQSAATDGEKILWRDDTQMSMDDALEIFTARL